MLLDALLIRTRVVGHAERMRVCSVASFAVCDPRTHAQEVLVSPHNANFKDVYIITDLMDTDLHRKYLIRIHDGI